MSSNSSTTLSSSNSINIKIESTPLPIKKVILLGLVLTANNSSIWMIFSFLPFMIKYFYPTLSYTELGYRAGILGSVFSAGAFIGNFIWGYVSDKYGRKPALIFGLIGTSISSLIFGFSPYFSIAILARFLWGLLNGNIGVAKTYLSEISDDTNSAKAMALFGVIGGFGRALGPIIGGFLSSPAEKYSIFQDTIFETYPFALPSLIICFNCFMVAILAFFNLEETLPKSLRRNNNKNSTSYSLLKSNIAEEEDDIDNEDDEIGDFLGNNSGNIELQELKKKKYRELSTKDIEVGNNNDIAIVEAEIDNNNNKNQDDNDEDDEGECSEIDLNLNLNLNINDLDNCNDLYDIVSEDSSDEDEEFKEEIKNELIQLKMEELEQNSNQNNINNDNDNSSNKQDEDYIIIKKKLTFSNIVENQSAETKEINYTQLKGIKYNEKSLNEDKLLLIKPDSYTYSPLINDKLVIKNNNSTDSSILNHINTYNYVYNSNNNQLKPINKRYTSGKITKKIKTKYKKLLLKNEKKYLNLIKSNKISYFKKLKLILLQKNIFLTTLLYGTSSFLIVSYTEIFPLFLVMKRYDGGFGFTSNDLGFSTMICGFLSVFIQYFYYTKLIDKYGLLNSMKISIFSFSFLCLLTPYLNEFYNLFYPNFDPNNNQQYFFLIIVINFFQTFTTIFNQWLLISNFVLINNSCYTEERATVNSIGQSMASTGRFIGPLIAAPFFALMAGKSVGDSSDEEISRRLFNNDGSSIFNPLSFLFSSFSTTPFSTLSPFQEPSFQASDPISDTSSFEPSFEPTFSPTLSPTSNFTSSRVWPFDYHFSFFLLALFNVVNLYIICKLPESIIKRKLTYEEKLSEKNENFDDISSEDDDCDISSEENSINKDYDIESGNNLGGISDLSRNYKEKKLKKKKYKIIKIKKNQDNQSYISSYKSNYNPLYSKIISPKILKK